MAAITTVIAGIGLAVAVGGAVTTFQAQQKQKKAQKKSADAQAKAAKSQKNSADLSRARSRRATAKQAQRALAESKVAGVNTGAGGGSSSIVGAQQGIQNIGTANALFQGQQQTLADNFGIFTEQANAFQSEANKQASNAQTGQAITGFGQQIVGGREDISTLFS